jgi:Asp-tRNA(Asn)/Glu-tRNA(Gln) amidotransferase A subunit family amidase
MSEVPAELIGLSLSQASELLAAGKVSSVELTRAILEQIGRTDPVVFAYATVMPEEAMRAAAQADTELARRGGWRGPLHGIPIGVKDIIYARGAPTEAGSEALRGFDPGRDATVVRRLKEGGAVVVGKTHTIEFAYGQSVPPTRNAWNADHAPGGSSSGSGTAVAIRSAFGAIGTDGGGSIRNPASFQGIVGLKPTCGRVSREGVIPMSASLDHVGPMARTVEDCALIMNVIAGYDPLDVQSINVPVPDYTRTLGLPIRGLRLGVERPYFFSDLDPEYRNYVDAAIEKLEDLGAVVVDIRVPELELVHGIFINIIATDTSAYHKRLLRKNPSGYVKKTRVMLEFGELLLGTDYLLAQRARQVLRQAVRESFAKHRLHGLITPSVSATAPSMTTEVSTDLFAFPLRQSAANILGLPSMNVPCGFATNGLPIGFEVYGRPFAEPLVFQVASAYQAVTEWHQRLPPLARAGAAVP